MIPSHRVSRGLFYLVFMRQLTKSLTTCFLLFVLICFSVEGGELFERIVAEEYLMEDDAVDYVKQILEALQFMHERHVVHLDLKVTNRTLLPFFIHQICAFSPARDWPKTVT